MLAQYKNLARKRFRMLERDTELLTQVQTLIKTAWIVVVLCLGWVVLGFYLSEPLILAISCLVILGSVLAISLALLGKPVLARIFWFASGIIAVTVSNFVVHQVAVPEILYLTLLGGPFLMFSIDRELRLLFTLLLLTALSLSLVLFLGNDYFIEPIIGAYTSRTYLLPANLLTVVVLVTTEMATFGIMSLRYQNKLKFARERAKSENAAKSDFLSTMSHEIRTPMNGVIGMTEILEGSGLTKDQSRMVGTIRNSADALMTIIEDVLDMSRIEAGKLSLVMGQVDLLDVVEKSIETLRPNFIENNVCLSLNFDNDLPHFVESDAGRLRQIILNLLSNAVKFSKRPPDQPSGRIDLLVQKTSETTLKIAIRDDGVGIEPEFVQRLFEPYAQEEKIEKGGFGGSGLGLAIVSKIVKRFDGQIDVSSCPNVVTTFTVTLPMLVPSGTQSTLDLRGKTIICHGLSDAVRDTICILVEASNGAFETVNERENLIAIAMRDPRNTVYVVPFSENPNDADAPAGNEYWGFATGTRAVFVARTQKQLSQKSDTRCAVVLGCPLLPSSFLEGLSKSLNLHDFH